MTLTVDLPQELEEELRVEATRLGVSLSEYALRLLSKWRLIHNIEFDLNTSPKTGTELVTYWQQTGLIGYRTDIADSETHARSIRSIAERRDWGSD